MPCTYKWVIPLCAAFLILTGCQDAQRSAASPSPAYMLSIDQLAAKLGLSVVGCTGRYCELSNASNRVLIFTHPGGNIYVNGRDIGPAGGIGQSGSKTYFPELLAPKIRSWLKTGYTAPLPPVTTTPRPSTYASGAVVIDPGHGGKDPGCISYFGDHEKGINLSIARKVVSRLKARGITVVMTRDSDVFVELDKRVNIANRVRPNLFVSIHCDSHGDRMHQGFTIYIAPTASDASRRAGRLLESALSRSGISSKGVRTNDFRVLVNTTCPAVLVECGFLSNPSEAALLLDPNHQNRLADAIADAVTQALN